MDTNKHWDLNVTNRTIDNRRLKQAQILTDSDGYYWKAVDGLGFIQRGRSWEGLASAVADLSRRVKITQETKI